MPEAAEALQVLVAGEAAGRVLALDEPLSFWGGFDSESGRIIDRAHPQCGETLSGRVVLMAAGRGSSSTSAVLAEAIRRGTAPAAMIMLEGDEIVTLGAIVADELYGVAMPVVVVDRATYDTVAAAGGAGVGSTGTITLQA